MLNIEKKIEKNENNTKRLKTMEKNVTEGLGLVADYKPNRISFYILLYKQIVSPACLHQ